MHRLTTHFGHSFDVTASAGAVCPEVWLSSLPTERTQTTAKRVQRIPLTFAFLLVFLPTSSLAAGQAGVAPLDLGTAWATRAAYTRTPPGPGLGSPAPPSQGRANRRAKPSEEHLSPGAPRPDFLGLPQNQPLEAYSGNWSGYVITGGVYDAVTGSFTVPSPVESAGGVPGATVCEWVGIDGYTNGSLVQAGVDEIPRAGGLVSYQPWWEVLPGPQVPVSGLPVQAGDTITVTIHKTGIAGWALAIRDTSSDHRYQTHLAYSGPATSAQWVIESQAAAGSTSSPPELAPYTPAVTFSHLGFSQPAGGQATATRLVMVQKGQAVSTPSPLTPAGFTVTYGITASQPSR